MTQTARQTGSFFSACDCTWHEEISFFCSSDGTSRGEISVKYSPDRLLYPDDISEVAKYCNYRGSFLWAREFLMNFLLGFVRCCHSMMGANVGQI